MLVREVNQGIESLVQTEQQQTNFGFTVSQVWMQKSLYLTTEWSCTYRSATTRDIDDKNASSCRKYNNHNQFTYSGRRLY